jgi:hypothetical protein
LKIGGSRIGALVVYKGRKSVPMFAIRLPQFLSALNSLKIILSASLCAAGFVVAAIPSTVLECSHVRLVWLQSLLSFPFLLCFDLFRMAESLVDQ